MLLPLSFPWIGESHCNLQTDVEVGYDGKLHATVRNSTSSRSKIFSHRSHVPNLGLSLTPRPLSLTDASTIMISTQCMNLLSREWIRCQEERKRKRWWQGLAHVSMVNVATTQMASRMAIATVG
ncbi:hypothetical protein V6N13_007891 [Hibiscus sabdariffa]